ncbi:hypothetical protein RsTz2092_00570 [Deferribacterales bacterium RsTz2092]|nr:hypothetical protein AGMMS49941_01140 [Deferribacterales bacterium]
MASVATNQVKAMTLRFDDPYDVAVIDMAAKAMNQTRSGFLILSAREKAERVLKSVSATRAEVETMLISPEAYERIEYRLAHPKKPNKKLTELMNRHDR